MLKDNLNIDSWETSLVVQWLRKTAIPLQGLPVSSLVEELKSCMPSSTAKIQEKGKKVRFNKVFKIIHA